MNLVEKIESGEINWNNVYDQTLEKSFTPILQSFSNLKDTNQGALKVNINSEFGALDNEYFSTNNRNISGSITFIGRLLNRLTGDNINRYLQKKFDGGEYIIYQDTDSCFFTTKIGVKDLFKITYDDGTTELVDKETLQILQNEI